MKKLTTLALFIAMFFGMANINGVCAKGEENGICLAWPQGLSVPANAEVIVSIRLGDQFTPYIQADRELEPKHPAVSMVRTKSAKDGRVDVDIIIRGEALLNALDRFQGSNQGPSGSLIINVLEIDPITVDNISGVFEASPGSSNHAARIVEVVINTTGNTGTESTAYQAIATNIQNNVAPVFQNARLSEVSNTTLADFTLFPNPVSSGAITLQAAGKITGTRLQVFNALGAVVAEYPVNPTDQQVQLNTDQLNAGVYFLRFEAEGKMQVRKFNVRR